MPLKWHIERAAVEQEILFPRPDLVAEYLKRAEDRGERCQVVGARRNPTGTVTMVVRKCYNKNRFFAEHNRKILAISNELTESQIRIDNDMEVDEDGCAIIAYIETWFDVDQKFGVDTASDDDTWLNMYGIYNPFEETLAVQCVLRQPRRTITFEYAPTDAERELIITKITDKIRTRYQQTPREFCNCDGNQC